MSERNETILRMYRDEGLKQADIGWVFGISESRVCQILSRLGYQGRDRARARVDARNREREEAARTRAEARAEDDKELARLWLAGATTFEIGAVFGIHPSVIGRRAKALGLPQRRHFGHGAPKAPRPEVLAAREITVLTERRGAACWCGGTVAMRCGWCAVRLCEDCARMTPEGVRCSGCVAA